MIISHIIGGLGNQMFQFAAGWALAKNQNTALKLDTSSFATYKLHHGFELARVYDANIEIATQGDMRDVLGWQSNRHVKKHLLRSALAPLRKPSMVVEPHFQYSDALDRVGNSVFLYGYWQSEKYFIRHQKELRQQFQFKQEPNVENKKWLELILNKNAVSIHVRRGDFISKENIGLHGACSIDYFNAAIVHLRERVSDPVFFFFSDDVEWAKENIHTNAPSYFVENNKGAESFNDMRLMSLCKHNIIANSSFSWWGAWLNAHQDKIVIAPKKWFANDLNTKDLLPASWVTF